MQYHSSKSFFASYLTYNTLARLSITCQPWEYWRLHASFTKGGLSCHTKMNKEEHYCVCTQHLGNKKPRSKQLTKICLRSSKMIPLSLITCIVKKAFVSSLIGSLQRKRKGIYSNTWGSCCGILSKHIGSKTILSS